MMTRKEKVSKAKVALETAIYYYNASQAKLALAQQETTRRKDEVDRCIDAIGEPPDEAEEPEAEGSDAGACKLYLAKLVIKTLADARSIMSTGYFKVRARLNGMPLSEQAAYVVELLADFGWEVDASIERDNVCGDDVGAMVSVTILGGK